eukprot:CAMPEP_0183337014 /NCGR_PEP_ID=MMETSP0164_2-20130417/4823_1 /TAXON_ID=221442 /ORGANISM="Coccolithus pelagicus ssp braarudi, Strain PLY182g" /LENGTH=388 /DNA_ID=CAMNT_0025506651 /DNA_START=95 /DNA_END=1261 /DNA_ORIENTATION=-
MSSSLLLALTSMLALEVSALPTEKSPKPTELVNEDTLAAEKDTHRRELGWAAFDVCQGSFCTRTCKNVRGGNWWGDRLLKRCAGVCSNCEEQEVLPTIAELAESIDELSTLVAATKATKHEYVSRLLNASRAKLTLFAPTNDAFAAFLEKKGLTAEEALALPNLGQILRGHLLFGKKDAAKLTANPLTVLNTAGGNMVLAKFDGEALTLAPAIGGSATVTTADAKASNGLVHIIDRVIDTEANVVDVAGSVPALSTLTAAIDAPQCEDVKKALSAKFGRYTVFAPTDDAFSAFFAEQNIYPEQALALDELPEILLGHAVFGVYTSEHLTAKPTTTLKTLGGSELTFIFDGTTLTVSPAVGGPATVAIANVAAANGIAHVITKVIDVLN